MASSLRVLSGSIVKGSTSVLLGSEYTEGQADGFRQGTNVRDFNDLSNSLTHKIRANSGLIRTVGGIDIDKNVFVVLLVSFVCFFC